MKNLLLSVFLFCQFFAGAQYYYKDVMGTSETAQMLAAYRKAKVRSVSVASYDADNTRSEAFSVQQSFSPDRNTLNTRTQSEASEPSVLITYLDAGGRVVKTVDSTETHSNVSVYQYNAAGQLQTITIQSKDTAGNFNQTEVHQWFWNGNAPTKMLRIKNSIDTAVVVFKTDDAGRVIEEEQLSKRLPSEPVYYYYDGQGRLSDIVRYNQKAKRLLPEYMFEYNSANQVVQRITVPANGSNYLIWRYQYDGNGLKIKEAVFNKNKQLTGKIEYTYSYSS